MECDGKVTPFRIMGRRLLVEGCVSVAGPHGEKFIFPYWYRELSPYVITFAW